MIEINDSEPLNHKQLRHSVADRLRAEILDGKLQPGEWLRQEKLAQEYGVSQMPIREAFKELAAEGLVEHVPYRGVRVVEFEPADVEDLYKVRAYMEGLAASSAAKVVVYKQIEELKQIQQQIRVSLSPEAIGKYRELNRRFHLIVINASQRMYLIRALNQLWDAFPTMLMSNFASTADHPLQNRDEADLMEHEAIIEALEKHDPQAAEVAVRKHIENTGAMLVKSLIES